MKKQRTIKQLRNRERVAQYSLFASEFVAIPTPYIVMGAVNFDEWFVQNPESWKIGLGGGIAIALMSIAMLLISAKKENKELTGGYIALIIGWYAFAFVALLLSQILYKIYEIMFVGGSGMLAAFGLDVGSKHFKKEADKHTNALLTAEAELDKEQAKDEMVRVKVK